MMIIDQAVFATAADAFNAHDLDQLSQLLDEDVVLSAPGGLGGEGRGACLDFYQRWFNEFPDAHVEVHVTYIVDGVAIEEGTFTGTHSSVSPSGRPVAFDYVQVSRFRGGRHRAVKLMFDRLRMVEQLGLVRDT
jgi:ketosteroid isomerase-like protein